MTAVWEDSPPTFATPAAANHGDTSTGSFGRDLRVETVSQRMTERI